ncbi:MULTISPECIES: ATP-binding protein [Caulobacter]|jgi:signal transduction histidine kinase/ActR/RegA family two-component response regulator|uniref:histidine kinase n=1 Tax=Caulobacter vibrioides OR37 TaxID=1292034 RepID=R0EID2_CAUVI|nr:MULTISPECIES: ATP-binding protein [Caulobacter]ENZ80952.1 signal transduction histidine kinase [Caulobacter vibrioides OR37]MBQ1561055.1 response regulator [Caulobacter sp.]
MIRLRDVLDRRRIWVKPVALTAAAMTAMVYSLSLAGATRNLPTIWTFNAVVVGGMMALSVRQGRALLIATTVMHVVVETAMGEAARVASTAALLDCVQIVVTVHLLRRLRAPARVRDIRGLALVLVASVLLTAALSILVHGGVTMSHGGHFWRGWSEWTASNTLGMAFGLPVTLILLDRRHREGFDPRPGETMINQALVMAASAFIFATDDTFQVLLFAPALLAAFRGGPRAVAWVVIASMAIAVPALLWRTGVDIDVALAPLRRALVFHVVLYTVSLVAALALARQARLQALLVRRQAAARAAEKRAQAANQAKSDFLATISHEIRTPLNSILGFAALVAEDPSLSPENRRRLDLVDSAGRSLTQIVGDLLDFAKVEAGRLELDPTPCSPAALLRDSVAIIAPEAIAKGLTLNTEIETVGEGDADALHALDDTRLRQVLLNLLANALKFTAQGSVTARLTLGPGAEDLGFEVIDTGIGIAPEVQARLFQRFSQGDSSIRRGYGGTGLGLAISKALVSRMGGEIGVESQLGQGARFWVRLTAQRCDAACVAANGCAPAPREAVATPDRAARVLLVDDHPMNRELGKALLTLVGCEVDTAEDGAEAVEAVRAGDFDLVLMDVHMPVMDGLAAARAIRALSGRPANVPIIALSADVLPEQVARCRAAGMDDHVAKPIRREALIAAVARALDGRPPAEIAERSAQ